MDLRVDSRVWRDVTAIASDYELARPGLGDEFVAAVVQAIERIRRTPAAWATWPGARPRARPLRRFVMARFPYGIGYQIRLQRSSSW